jgi:hypothetical protein
MRKTERQVSVLPDPLSPTNANVSPGFTEKLTSCTTGGALPNPIDSPCTSNRGFIYIPVFTALELCNRFKKTVKPVSYP